MNLVKSVSAAAVAGVTVTLLGATPAEAAVRVRIEQVQYDSPGRDTGTNRSLNAEWVRITNHGTRARHLDDWRLRDRQGHTFRFPGLHAASGAQRPDPHRQRSRRQERPVLGKQLLHLEQHR